MASGNGSVLKNRARSVTLISVNTETWLVRGLWALEETLSVEPWETPRVALGTVSPGRRVPSSLVGRANRYSASRERRDPPVRVLRNNHWELPNSRISWLPDHFLYPTR